MIYQASFFIGGATFQAGSGTLVQTLDNFTSSGSGTLTSSFSPISHPFTGTASGTFTVDTGATHIRIRLWGRGGGGGRNEDDYDVLNLGDPTGGGGGGGGGGFIEWNGACVGGDTLSYNCSDGSTNCVVSGTLTGGGGVSCNAHHGLPGSNGFGHGLGGPGGAAGTASGGNTTNAAGLAGQDGDSFVGQDGVGGEGLGGDGGNGDGINDGDAGSPSGSTAPNNAKIEFYLT